MGQSVLFALALLCIAYGDRWAGMNAVLDRAVQEGAFPGAVAAVGNSQGLLYARALGKFTYGIPAPRDPGSDLSFLCVVVCSCFFVLISRDWGRVRAVNGVAHTLRYGLVQQSDGSDDSSSDTVSRGTVGHIGTGHELLGLLLWLQWEEPYSCGGSSLASIGISGRSFSGVLGRAVWVSQLCFVAPGT
jgi:hypothetical protein